ncbi:ribosome biogenesis GTPase Der, partial [Streptomyces diastatochromogenes]
MTGRSTDHHDERRGTDFMNDQIQPDGSAEHEYEHGALGDAEYAEFMELAAEEG